MALGEIGLTGEVMPVSKIGPRLKEAVKMKFDRFLLPEGKQGGSDRFLQKSWPQRYAGLHGLHQAFVGSLGVYTFDTPFGGSMKCAAFPLGMALFCSHHFTEEIPSKCDKI